MPKNRYSTDLTEAQWQYIAADVLTEEDYGRPRITDLREVVNAILYMSRSGCQWNMLPRDFPPKSTVHYYFKKWKTNGTWDAIMQSLREFIRIKKGRNRNPTASIIDAQSVKTTSLTESKGYDGHKCIKGRKRHIAVDVLGLILYVVVHSAGIQDRKGGKMLMKKLLSIFPTIKKIWADGGYTGQTMVDWVKSIAACVFSVVTKPRKKFEIVQWRWIVERTFGWLNFHRRLSKDYEYYNSSSEAWIKVAAINMMLHRLSPG